jgi:hypothetical protein
VFCFKLYFTTFLSSFFDQVTRIRDPDYIPTTEVRQKVCSCLLLIQHSICLHRIWFIHVWFYQIFSKCPSILKQNERILSMLSKFHTKKCWVHVFFLWSLLEMDLLREKQQESIQSFCENANAIIFITDCSCFNMMTDEKGCQTQLHQSLDLFKTIRNNK